LDQRERAMKAEFEAEVNKYITREEKRLRDVRKRAQQLEDINVDMQHSLSQDKVTFLQVRSVQYEVQWTFIVCIDQLCVYA
jgi:hypothetical protein